jgi:hypothetical protein
MLLYLLPPDPKFPQLVSLVVCFGAEALLPKDCQVVSQNLIIARTLIIAKKHTMFWYS